MRVHCPKCHHGSNVQVPRPGQFLIRCKQCDHRFAVDLVPDSYSSLQAPSPPPRAGMRDLIGATSAPPSTMDAGPDEPTRTMPPADFGQVEPDQPTIAPAAGAKPRLGGYELIQKLGQGGMGEVYLARQVSLDRKVALKLLADYLAHDPSFVARFTREAYAAAQLTHHNIVAIYDIGADRQKHFFSMEFVEGQTLSGALEEAGKFEPNTACGYIVQAARGLQFAHDHGMIHRDIKPDNLLLNDLGILKVADLGLVKRANVRDEKSAATATAVPGSNRADQTQFNVSLGTPAYMPPEQATDAARVDHRADIYSLGCTLYALLTGRPPFMGSTGTEVIQKHQSQPVTPPEMLVRNLPKTLSSIVMKMVAKRPEERYPSMNAVVLALEDYLGVASNGPLAAKQEQVKVIESAAERFSKSGFLVLRRQIIYAFYAIAAILVVMFAWMGSPLAAGAVVGTMILGLISYQLIVGMRERTYLLLMFRGLVFGASVFDWAMWIAGIALVLFILNATGWLLPWIGVSLLAVGLALGFHLSLDQLVKRERAQPLDEINQLLRQMRQRGVDETGLRQLIFQHSGNDWEELYETLFDYPAKLKARELWVKGDLAHRRRRFGAWRDGLINWISRKQDQRRQHRDAKMLAQIERKALIAEGVSETEAGQKAKQHAQRIQQLGKKIRKGPPKRVDMNAKPSPGQTLPPPGANFAPVFIPTDLIKPVRPKLSDEDFEREHMSWLRRRFGTPLDILFGAKLRFLLAAIFLAGFGLWSQQTKALNQAADVLTAHREIETSFDKLTTKAQAAAAAAVQSAQAAPSHVRALNFPWTPAWLNQTLSGWNAAIAGVILLLSCLCHGRFMTVGVLLGAAVAVYGYQINVPYAPFLSQPWIAAGAGAAIGALSMIFLRRAES